MMCEENINNNFLLDSGATEHIINDLRLFTNYKKLEEPLSITVAKKGETIQATHTGKIQVKTIGYSGELINVLYSKSVPTNLISVRRIQEAGMCVVFKENGQVEINKGSTKLIQGKRINNLYIIELIVQNAQNKARAAGHVAVISNMDKYKIWHERLGHISQEKFSKIKINKLVVDDIYLRDINPNNLLCEACISGRQTRLPFAKTKDKMYIKRPLFVVHSDVCGPITPSTIDNKNYFLNFIDDYTHYTVTYLMSNKSEVFTYFKDYVAKAAAHFNSKLVHLYCDNGREYLSGEMKELCKQNGITYHLTVPYTPQQNGVAERMNRTITEKARTMVYSAGLDKSFWGEAVLTATYLINRSPTKAINLNKTPYELWHNRKPTLNNLKIFGCTAYIHNKTKRTKFDSKSFKGIFVGYVPNGYKIFEPKSKKFIVARDVIFDESTYKKSRLELDELIKIGSEINHDTSLNTEENIPDKGPKGVSTKGDVDSNSVENMIPGKTDSNKCKQTPKKIGVSENCIQGQTSSIRDVSDENMSSNSDDASPCTSNKLRKLNNMQDIRRSERLKSKPIKCYKDDNFEINNYLIGNQMFKIDIPKCYQEVTHSVSRLEWEKAIKDELKSLEQNKTWTLVQKPNNLNNIIDSKWVFTLKGDRDGNWVKYKARLVARGFNQRKTLDYDETFAPVARISTFRCMVAFANQYELLIHQMDVKTAFLNGTLKENIYMRVPDGVVVKENEVCKLNKSLYGLKQSARCWYECFNKKLIEKGFKNSPFDNCLYFLNKGEINKNIYVILYVDDLVIVTKNINIMNNFKIYLNQQFEMVDLKEIDYFLGIRITRSNSEILLDQTTYLKSILQKFNMTDCTSVSTPLYVKVNYTALNSEDEYDAPCQNLLGCLMYAMLCTRPDLCTAVNILSRYQTKCNKELWICLKRVLRYVKGTIDLKLVYKRIDNYEQILTGYVDADWANNELDRRSTSGCLFKLFDKCTVTWFTRRQNSVATSSTESEYMAVFEAVKEALWLRSLLVSINVNMLKPIVLYEDNQSCIAMANNTINHKRSKHIDIKYHFTREQIENKIICLKYLSTDNQEADVLTKSLPPQQFKILREKIGVQEIEDSKLIN